MTRVRTMLLNLRMLRSGSRVALAEIARRQWGRVTWAQTQALGVPEGTVVLWRKQGYLHQLLPRVYAVGHPARSTESDLAAALLYAGPGAMLSHATAAWWLGLLDERPRTIHVSTPRQCRSLNGIRVHQRSTCHRTWHRRLPVTTLPRTLLDLAAKAPLRTVRCALAKAEYERTLNVAEIEAMLGKGRPGSTKLRLALERHQPRLGRTKSRLEALFFEISEAAGFPSPELNVPVNGWEVDALWRDKRIAIELDGYGNHHTPAQLKRDRRKELALRAAGYTPARYSEEQLSEHTEEVVADLRALRGT